MWPRSTKGDAVSVEEKVTPALMVELVWEALEDPECGFDPDTLGTYLAKSLNERLSDG